MTDRDATTVLLIDAGVTSLVEAPQDILERGLRSEQVVNQAGASQATFFRKFRTKSEFIEAVITSLTESTLHSADKVKQTVRAQLAANDDALRPTVTTLVKEAFDAIVNDASTARSLLSHIFLRAHTGEPPPLWKSNIVDATSSCPLPTRPFSRKPTQHSEGRSPPRPSLSPSTR